MIYDVCYDKLFFTFLFFLFYLSRRDFFIIFALSARKKANKKVKITSFFFKFN